MSAQISFVSALCLVLIFGGCKDTSQQQEKPKIVLNGELQLEKVIDGLDRPLYLTAPPSDPRLFIVEQPGRIWIVENNGLLPKPFLDITDRVKTGKPGGYSEEGLLGLAFHPQYAQNGFFYLNYTDYRSYTRIERFSVSSDRNVADVSSAKLILRIRQPGKLHNGGHTMFGPDGMLYIGMGDGGRKPGDGDGNSQNRANLLGDLLRIDVDHGDPYSIPADNPFLGTSGVRSEIWAWGLRNPWRFSFDPVTELLYIANSGEDHWEEVNVIDAKRSGLNFGWNIMEAKHCFQSQNCDKSDLVEPVLEYDHSQGCCIIGGSVYRGKALPALTGHYFYADYCLGWIRSFEFTDDSINHHKTWKLGVESNVLSFGEDAFHEIYILYSNGSVYRIAPKKGRS